MFHIGEPSQTKVKASETASGRIGLVTDGQWRFSTFQAHVDAKKNIHVVRLDEHGNGDFTASAPLYKAELVWHEMLQAHVLTSEYGGAKPVALFRGLATSTVRLIEEQMQQAGTMQFGLRRQYQETPFALDSLDDKKRLARLADRLGLSGQSGSHSDAAPVTD